MPTQTYYKMSNKVNQYNEQKNIQLVIYSLPFRSHRTALKNCLRLIFIARRAGIATTLHNVIY